MVYSLLATCKARGIDERAWLEDVLRRMLTFETPKMDDAAFEKQKDRYLRKSGAYTTHSTRQTA